MRDDVFVFGMRRSAPEGRHHREKCVFIALNCTHILLREFRCGGFELDLVLHLKIKCYL